VLNLKKATFDEVELYQKIIYPAQDRILRAVGEEFGDAFYLTGGTALSRFYFGHRLSEDLDLFTESENIRTAIPRIVKLIESLGYGVEVHSRSVTFGRLFAVLENGERLKIDLAADNPIEKPQPFKGFYLDTLKNIAVNKITAFEDRAEIKDLIDLYYLVKKAGISIEEILELADRKRVPVPYENLLAVNSIGLTGSVSLLVELDEKELEDFLGALKRALEENVKKKVLRAKERLRETVKGLLWDHPLRDRKISPETASILMRRAEKLSFPEKVALLESLRNCGQKTCS